ncbi:MAG: aldo/keto reductase [Deltaproteobacteria bacterium]|nr:aldo/keto reductase [Deltaproteobacteria bacterium]
MKTKTLGRTEVQVPEIGLGVWQYRGGVEPLRHGIELGANLIDTAEMYRTEDVVGEAVQGMRERVFIASKVSGDHLGYDQVLRAADASLRRLGIDCIDLYQVHWPSRSTPIEETMRAMGTLVDTGRIRFIGVSNFSTEELEEARAALSHHPIVSNQVLYNLRRREIERTLMPYCQRHGVTIIAYTPLDSGRLAAGRGLFSSRGAKVLQELAEAHRKTAAQVALNWCISHDGVIAIPKSDSVSRTAENCGASDWRLSAEDMARLDRAFA